MKRLLFLCLLAATAWLQFEFFPGHAYLLGDTQVLIPALEHLDRPGFLSRDPVATHPAFTYTLYDEITLFVHRSTGWSLQKVLELQQLAFRFAGLLGIFLLARHAGLDRLPALILSALVMCGGHAFGPAIPLIDRDPEPAAFAVQSTLLAAGLFASSRPLLAGLFGGISLIYDPRIAAPLWIVAILAVIFDSATRRMFRASLPILAIFALLLANASQLQPAIPETREFFERLPVAIASAIRFRSPQLWVFSWNPLAVVWNVLLFACAITLVRLVWRFLPGPARWIFVGLPGAGIAGMLSSAALLDGAGWAVVPEWQPAHLLIFTALFASTLSGIVAFHWFKTRNTWAAAFLVLPLLLPLTNHRIVVGPDPSPLSDWANSNTWGGSMFLFPDAGHALYPGIFRAQSLRPVWVDWETGSLSDHFDSFADEWYRRWQDTMSGTYSEQSLRRFSSLPIDYFVVQRAHAVRGANPVYSDRDFLVYDAHDLRRGG